jgi:hypothetical protein
VPYIQTAPFKLDRAMICWDGSRPAVRAIADAIPLLALAERNEVVIAVDESDNKMMSSMVSALVNISLVMGLT